MNAKKNNKTAKADTPEASANTPERTNEMVTTTMNKDAQAVIGGLDSAQMLDMMGTPVTIADKDMVIRYANEAAVDMFKKMEGDIRKDLPNFRASKIVGTCVDDFHKDPSHQRGMVGGLDGRYDGALSVGGHHFDFIAVPRFDENGDLQAVIVEWSDQTDAKNATSEALRMVEEIEKMSNAHDAGDIDVVCDDSAFTGEFAKALKAVNYMVNQHIETKKKAIGFAVELGKGNYDAELETFPRKKAFINDAMEGMRKVLRDNAHNVDTLLAEIRQMAEAHDLGDIDHIVDTSKLSGTLADVGGRVNDMVNQHIETKKKAIGFAVELGKGNFDAELERFPRKKAFINDAMDGVKAVLQDNAKNVDALLGEIRNMAKSHDLGDIDVVVDTEKLTGTFEDVGRRVNDMVNQHIDTKKKAIAFVLELANGNFEAELEQFPRQKAFINNAMEQVRGNFKNVVSSVEGIAQSLVDGNFDIDVNPAEFNGSFRDVINTMLSISTNFNDVIAEIERLSNGIVQGKLDTTVNTAEFRGSYGSIMRAFEAAFTSLNAAFGTITSQVKQITTTVEQMSQSSQALATNSQIQSSSVDEVSSSTEETESQVKSNATAASAARDLVVGASTVAADGKVKIGEMVTAMDGIRASSQDIAKIIKVIDEIAFQTNLLALNAAVEAARAGQHGRGFAVVAQEVRNLAGRSAKAARETSELIESASTRVQDGVRIADETSSAFTSIVEDIEKVRTLVGDIATASDEQSRGVAQINVAVSEIAKSALATSQQADELAASAAQMQSATESMRNEVSRFNLRSTVSAMPSMSGLDGVSPEMMAQIQQMLAAQGNANMAPMAAARTGTMNRNSDRDERGFGNF